MSWWWKHDIYIDLSDFHDILRIASTIDKNYKRSFMTNFEIVQSNSN
jgi:hypothetical protein